MIVYEITSVEWIFELSIRIVDGGRRWCRIVAGGGSLKTQRLLQVEVIYIIYTIYLKKIKIYFHNIWKNNNPLLDNFNLDKTLSNFFFLENWKKKLIIHYLKIDNTFINNFFYKIDNTFFNNFFWKNIKTKKYWYHGIEDLAKVPV